MEKTGKMVVWLCMVRMFFMGCYSSALINPSDLEQEEMRSKTIKKVVANDGRTYVFSKTSVFRDESTMATRDSVIGYSDGKRVSIALSEVAEVHVKEFQPVMTALAVLGGVGIGVGLIVALSSYKGFSISLSGSGSH